MAQTKARKQPPRQRAQEAVEEVKAPDSEHVTTEDIDAMLDEIDAVLEENAEDFVKGYIQKGGQ